MRKSLFAGTSPPAAANSAPDLVECSRCAGRGVVRLYSVHGAARRAPYSTHPCPVCRGRGRALAFQADPLGGAVTWALVVAVAALVVVLSLS
jgi:hypothetical protein